MAAIPVVVRFDPPAWDFNVYRHAMDSVRAGHDPYLDAIAVQNSVHQRAPESPLLYGPFLYIYSPMTLPVVKAFGRMPFLAAGALYWLIYAAGVAALSWFGVNLMEESERRVLGYYVPAAMFFPGLLGSDSVLSGNVAYILYGAVLVAAARALKTGRWRWFYIAVLAASCVKAPLLTLLTIPILCARRQWFPSLAAAAGGLALFAVEPLIWPELFRNYLRSLGLAFSVNRDFGFSPAGLFSGWLFDRRLPYFPASIIFYAIYAAPLFAVLVYLSRSYLRNEFSTREWLPVMLTGVILLNPRLIEYDVAPLALPLAVLCWRMFSANRGMAATLMRAGSVFLVVNLLAASTWNLWKLTEGPLLSALFLTGALSLIRSPSVAPEGAGIPVALTEA
ncbi:MAG TPA: glycosyltransferase 87 family protein [Acidobacteriaceae bacterium]|nr:glycosyltransferase 87 family protein [Acidobacteriaceae bacterium]